MIHSIFFNILSILVISFSTACINRGDSSSNAIALADIDCRDSMSFDNVNRYIAHAGGAIDGVTYTDSIDALESSYRNGFRLFEVDLLETRDGHLVGAHSWDGDNGWAPMSGSSVKVPSLVEYNSKLIDRRFRPLDFPTLLKFFTENADAVLVTDKTKDYEFLAKNFVDPNRLIVEVFDEAGLKSALEKGIRFPMPSFAYDVTEMSRIHETYGIKFFALHHLTTKDIGAALSQIRQKNICLFAYSSNDETYMKEQMANGLFGFYTDFYEPKSRSFSCTGVVCNSY